MSDTVLNNERVTINQTDLALYSNHPTVMT